MKKGPTKQHILDVQLLLSIIESYIKSGHIKSSDPEYEAYRDIKMRNSIRYGRH